MSSDPLLSVESLSIAFGDARVVDTLSFTVNRGETVALVGESGSGKSVTALAIMGLLQRSGGRIVGGRILFFPEASAPAIDLATLDEAVLRTLRGRRLAMIFQEPMTALNPVMSIGEQISEVLALHRGLRGPALKEAAIAALARVRLPDPARRLRQFPHELSGGQRQRVMIAMALAGQPDLLIADEPTTALDVTTQAEILALLRTLQAEVGMSMLFITHDMGVVAEMAARMIVIRKGRKEEEGSVHQVFARPTAAYTRMLLKAAPRLGSGVRAGPSRRGEPVLEVENLFVRYPVLTPFKPWQRQVHYAVAGVSFTLRRGETLGLVGESGCGKSTVARAILRLIEPAAGCVRLFGRDLSGEPRHSLRRLRADAQIVFQDPFASLNPRLRALDLVTEPAVIHSRVPAGNRRALAESLLERVGLDPAFVDRYPHEFSGGQRQRLCIARALSVAPTVIVADEPLSALDVSVAHQISELLASLQREEGLALLFISHDLAVVERLAHRVAVMQAGQIVELGPTETVLARPSHPYTRRLLAAVPRPEAGLLQHTLPPAPDLPPLVLPLSAIPPPARMREISPGHYVRALEEAPTTSFPIRPERHKSAAHF